MNDISNPLIKDELIKTLSAVEDNLRFIQSYFVCTDKADQAVDDPRISNGLVSTLELNINAINYEINKAIGSCK